LVLSTATKGVLRITLNGIMFNIYTTVFKSLFYKGNRILVLLINSYFLCTYLSMYTISRISKALFGIFSGIVGMFSLMQSTQVPKSVNYYLLTFIFCMKIYFNLQSHNKSIFKFTKTLLYFNINMQK
jgi:hypothetical protein